ncbi:hypothetical protein ABZ746_04755 [Streptomyces sp. NPDC020096]
MSDAPLAFGTGDPEAAGPRAAAMAVLSPSGRRSEQDEPVSDAREAAGPRAAAMAVLSPSGRRSEQDEQELS